MSESAKKKRGLGRGLGALISAQPVRVDVVSQVERPSGEVKKNDKVVELSNRANRSESTDFEEKKIATNNLLPADELVRFVPINNVTPNPEQPRKSFNQQEVSELAASIKELGVLQPIVVRPLSNEEFQIVAGERRWRAAKEVRLAQIPVIIKKFSDKQALEVGLVENVQRSDLTPLEEARGYEELMKRFNLSQQEVADKVAKDRTTVANAVRLLRLPIEVQAFIESGAISVGHAKALLSVKEPKLQVALAHKVLKERLSVRDLERIVNRKVNLNTPSRKGAFGKSVNNEGEKQSTFQISEDMQRALGTKVRVVEHASGRGKIVVEYFSREELSRIYDLICK